MPGMIYKEWLLCKIDASTTFFDFQAGCQLMHSVEEDPF